VSSSTASVAAERRDGILSGADRASLLAACRDGRDRGRRGQRPVLVSWARRLQLADPVAIWSHARSGAARSFFWQSAWDHGLILAIGTARELRGRGASRMASVRDGWAALSRDLVTGAAAAASLSSGDGPLAIGAFAFSPDDTASERRLPDALMWVPALQVRGRVPASAAPAGDVPAELRLNAMLFHDSDPEQVADGLVRLAERCLRWEDGREQAPWAHPAEPARERTYTSAELPAADEWRKLVRHATDHIRDGHIEKVVLAREFRVTASAPFDVPAAVHRLRTGNPGTTLFAIDHERYTFLGATPEYLVRVDNRGVHALGLAGTTPRGATPAQDAAFESELVGSAKIQHEHDVVVRMLDDALRESCVEVKTEAPRSVVKLANVQHLSTKIRGRLPEDSPAGILDLVDRLHPTPAVGGHPREESLSWLAANEGLDRSWYGGVVGWTDQFGQGQFGVAIRSALLDGRSASLYAGCGIVADSDPEAEYAETCAKLRPMMSALDIA
jgi:isochorismate synthase